jgi:hypothetical protein
MIDKIIDEIEKASWITIMLIWFLGLAIYAIKTNKREINNVHARITHLKQRQDDIRKDQLAIVQMLMQTAADTNRNTDDLYGHTTFGIGLPTELDCYKCHVYGGGE